MKRKLGVAVLLAALAAGALAPTAMAQCGGGVLIKFDADCFAWESIYTTPADALNPYLVKAGSALNVVGIITLFCYPFDDLVLPDALAQVPGLGMPLLGEERVELELGLVLYVVDGLGRRAEAEQAQQADLPARRRLLLWRLRPGGQCSDNNCEDSKEKGTGGGAGGSFSTIRHGVLPVDECRAMRPRNTKRRFPRMASKPSPEHVLSYHRAQRKERCLLSAAVLSVNENLEEGGTARGPPADPSV